MCEAKDPGSVERCRGKSVSYTIPVSDGFRMVKAKVREKRVR
jgi:hypothetical protein